MKVSKNKRNWKKNEKKCRRRLDTKYPNEKEKGKKEKKRKES